MAVEIEWKKTMLGSGDGPTWGAWQTHFARTWQIRPMLVVMPASRTAAVQVY